MSVDEHYRHTDNFGYEPSPPAVPFGTGIDGQNVKRMFASNFRPGFDVAIEAEMKKILVLLKITAPPEETAILAPAAV
jgi:hypothetical protein